MKGRNRKFIAALAVVQILFGAVGVLGSVYASTYIVDAQARIDRVVTDVRQLKVDIQSTLSSVSTGLNTVQRDMESIQRYTSDMSGVVDSAGDAINFHLYLEFMGFTLLDWYPLGPVAASLYDLSDTLGDASKTVRDARQAMQNTSSSLNMVSSSITDLMNNVEWELTWMKNTGISYAWYMLLYFAALNIIFILNGAAWIIYSRHNGNHSREE